MNHQTELNSELLSEEARGKKHIPFAVFAVILIHVVLFVVLLVAAGCRSTARAKTNRPAPAPVLQPNPADQYLQAAASNTVPAQSLSSATEQVIATEPVVPNEPQFASAPAVTAFQPRNDATAGASPIQRRENRPVPQKAAAKTSSVRQTFHVVQSGDTVEKIAKQHGTTIQAIKVANKLKGHTIYPGQKLLVKPASASSTAQVKKANTSNEV